MDDDQIVVYDSLIQWHRREVELNEKQILMLKNNLYGLLKSGQNNSQKDTLISQIGGKQVYLENIHFKHFEDLKNLCTPEQLTKFDTLMSDIAAMFQNKHSKPHQNK